MLSDLIARYLAAKAIWEAQFDEDDVKANNSPEWREYMDTSCAIIDFPCRTIRQVQQKARFILTDENLVDMLANCSTTVAVTDFLKSLAGHPVENEPVDSVDNGEKRG